MRKNLEICSSFFSYHVEKKKKTFCHNDYRYIFVSHPKYSRDKEKIYNMREQLFFELITKIDTQK